MILYSAVAGLLSWSESMVLIKWYCTFKNRHQYVSMGIQENIPYLLFNPHFFKEEKKKPETPPWLW